MRKSLQTSIIVALVAILPLGLVARERSAKRGAKNQPVGEQVEMFAAMKSGQLDVKFIPRDSRQAQVLIENKTDKPLSVKLPETFAATPVLAQIGGGVGRGGTSATTGGGAQSAGGGMGMGGMGMGGMGMGGGGMGGMGGGGFFNVPAEKVGKIKVECVCLEHGKSEPRAAIPYEIKPFNEFSSDKRVAQVLRLLAAGKSSQRVAQAATWHLTDNMSWAELANKQIEHIGAPNEPYFSAAEIQAAMQMVSVATHMAEEVADESPADHPKEATPGETDPSQPLDEPVAGR
ncbi:MAG: hypothetical protein K1X71_08200 [Pirellulales bacterium]|nr:hypothetical protein [Pirellulales bacterium]